MCDWSIASVISAFFSLWSASVAALIWLSFVLCFSVTPRGGPGGGRGSSSKRARREDTHFLVGPQLVAYFEISVEDVLPSTRTAPRTRREGYAVEV